MRAIFPLARRLLLDVRKVRPEMRTRRWGMGCTLLLASGLAGCGLVGDTPTGETGYLGAGGASASNAGGSSQGKGGTSQGKGGTSQGKGGTSQGGSDNPAGGTNAGGAGNATGTGGFGNNTGTGGFGNNTGKGGATGKGGTNAGGAGNAPGAGGFGNNTGKGGFGNGPGVGGAGNAPGAGGFGNNTGKGGFGNGPGAGGFGNGPGAGGFGNGPGAGGFGNGPGTGGFGPGPGAGGFGNGPGTGGSAGVGGEFVGPMGTGGSPIGTGGSAGVGASGGATTGGGGDAGAGGSPACGQDPTLDIDGDGWSPNQGDCNDCDANVNPGAYDVVNYEKDASGKPTTTPLPPEQQVDEDCSGSPTQFGEDVSCDAGLGPDAFSVWDTARAIGLCRVQVPLDPPDPHDRTWGVLEAAFSDISGPFLSSPVKVSAKPMNLNYGILPNFGPNTAPFEGTRILGLSSGQARAPGQAGYEQGVDGQFDKQYSSNYPIGFPKNGSCGTTGQPHDGVALDYRIRVPTNARSFSFQFRFFTYEYPVYVCEMYNDVFAVLMSPNPLPNTDPMYPDIAFEQVGMTRNVIGVNNQSFLTACQKGTTMFPYPNCVGEKDLMGSGFEGHGASAWLRNIAPVGPGTTIDLRFAIWDSADGIFDSSVVIDDFRWRVEEGTLQTIQTDGGM